jgi:hypothetical protein
MSRLDELQQEIQELRDVLQIQRVIYGVTLYSDLRDYARSEALFTEHATLDYSYFFGADAAALKVKTHWDNVRLLAPGFDATHHQTTNLDIEVRGDTATATSLVRATLRVADHTCTDGGVYIHDLVRTSDGWRIKRQVFKGSYHEGDDVIERARMRAAQMREKDSSA